MVESTALEMRHTGNRIGGSNPSLSASVLFLGVSPYFKMLAKRLSHRHFLLFAFLDVSPYLS